MYTEHYTSFVISLRCQSAIRPQPRDGAMHRRPGMQEELGLRYTRTEGDSETAVRSTNGPWKPPIPPACDPSPRASIPHQLLPSEAPEARTARAGSLPGLLLRYDSAFVPHSVLGAADCSSSRNKDCRHLGVCLRLAGIGLASSCSTLIPLTHAPRGSAPGV